MLGSDGTLRTGLFYRGGDLPGHDACGIVVLSGRRRRASDRHQQQRQRPGLTAQCDRRSFPGNTIIVPAGDYALTSGELAITKSLTIQGAGARSTILDGSSKQRVLHVIAPATLSLSSVSVSNGNQTGPGQIVAGAGIFVDNEATLILDRAAITNNTADASTTGSLSGSALGGGIDASGPQSTLTITNSTFTGNIARADATKTPGGNAFGGAIYSNMGTLTLTNSTIEGNHASGSTTAAAKGGIVQGGGVFADGSATLLNDTLAGGSVVAAGSPAGQAEGGNIFEAGGAEVLESLRDTIISGGVASAGTNCGGPLISFGHNIESANTCHMTAPGDRPNTDAMIGPLANNGGPTDTEAIPMTSPAFDAGDPMECPLTDQRGFPRPQGASCDIGAFEFLAAALAVTGAATAVTPTSVTLTGSADAGLGRPATAAFQYGSTPAYGSQTPAQTLMPTLGAQGLSASLSGLAPSTTYHFRLIASNALGTALGADATFVTPATLASPAGPAGPTPIVDRITNVKITPTTLVAASRGASIARAARRATGALVSYGGTQPATTTFTILLASAGRQQGRACVKPAKRNRTRKRCTRYLNLGSFTHTDIAGANRFRFTGRVGGRKLKPGTYRMRATPRNGAGAGPTAYTQFRVKP
jgi:hypothetical protein